MAINELLTQFSEQKGILLGVCDAERMDYLIPLLTAAQTPFVHREIERRINPKAIMPECKSVIVIGVSCGYTCQKQQNDIVRGRIASIGIGEDYHVKLKRLLAELAEYLGGGFDYKIFVDSGHLVERALAAKAGLGFIGKNGFAVSEKFGTFFNIGYMLTDLELNYDKPAESLCGSCDKCLKACTTGALSENFVICDLDKCVAYITQQKNGLSQKQQDSMGSWLYGCDICQLACPYSQAASAAFPICDPSEMYPQLDEILSMTEQEFNEKYGSRALFWRGYDIILRNAGIIADKNGKNRGDGKWDIGAQEACEEAHLKK